MPRDARRYFAVDEDMRMHRMISVAAVLFLALASAPVAAAEKIAAGKEGKL